MFDISDGKGFQMKFENGWTVSVQFGAGNYSDNYSERNYGEYCGSSRTAEIAAWPKDGEWHRFSDGDMVNGYVSADEVADFIFMIKNKDA